MKKYSPEWLKQGTDIDRDELTSIAKEVFGKHLNYVAEEKHSFSLILNPDYLFSLNDLMTLSQRAGTKLIDISHEEGFGGSECTGADPDTNSIIIYRCI